MIISGGPTDIRHQSEDYGVPGTDSYNFFRLGKSYSVTVDHAGTHSQYKASANDPDCEIEYRGSTWCNNPSPDYDYVATVQPQSVGFIIQDENTPALLGTSNGSETNEAAGKTARFGFPKPVVSFTDYTEEEVEGDPGVLVLVNDNDSNEDGEIDKDEPFANDPDYVEIRLKLELEGMTVDEGTARLSANRNADLRVRDPADWSTPHNLPLEWDMATPEATSLQGSGKTLFIEALAPSDSHKDFTLTFEYTNDGTTSRDTELTLLKVDFEIEDEHFADNIMDTAETDEDLEQFIMARGSTLNPDPFEITIRPSDSFGAISKARYRLISPNETGGTDEFDGPFTAEVTGLTVNYHNEEPAELHVGIDTNGNNELDESEFLKTVPIHPLYWNVTGADSEQSLGLIQTVPSDVLLWEAAGELASYLYDNQFKTIITGPVDGLNLLVRYTSTEDTDDWFEEAIGDITPEGSKVADLEMTDYEFPGSEGGSGMTEQVLLSSGARMIYTEPTAGGTRNPIDESIWSQLWSNYSYGVVHNDDVSIEIKREERAGIYKTVLNSFVGGAVKNEGQALRQFHRVLMDKHGTGSSPSDDSIEVSDYDAFYQKLIFGARAAGAAKYASTIGVEETGGFKGLIMSGDNMEWWVRGTQRTGYDQTGPDGFDADYKVIDYQEFSSKPFIQERINKYLIGWPVKNSSAGTTLLESILADSRLNIGNIGETFDYTERNIQINVNDYQNLSDMQDLARALGTFGIRAVNSNTLSGHEAEGGTWEIHQVAGTDFLLKINVKLEVFDRYDWHAGQDFGIPVPDGESPDELRVPDNWQRHYETLSGNYLGGQAKPFNMGTKYEWSVIQVDVPLVYTNGNLQLATPVGTE